MKHRACWQRCHVQPVRPACRPELQGSSHQGRQKGRAEVSIKQSLLKPALFRYLTNRESRGGPPDLLLVHIVWKIEIKLLSLQTKRNKRNMSIDTYKLTSMEEPTDEVLEQLMREAAEEASLTNREATLRFFEEIKQAAAAY